MNEAEGLHLIVKPTVAVAATNKAHGLSAQADTIAAASVGGTVFRSADTLLVSIPKVKGYQK